MKKILTIIACSYALYGQAQNIEKADSTLRFNALKYAQQKRSGRMMFDKNPIAAHTFFKSGIGIGTTTSQTIGVIKPTTSLEIGKWFNPVNGLSLDWSSSYLDNESFYLVGANYLFNASSFVTKEETNKWEIWLKGGAKFGAVNNRSIYGAAMGLSIAHRITKNLALYIEPNFNILSDKFDKQNEWNGFDSYAQIQFGVMYTMLNHELRTWKNLHQGWFAQVAYGGAMLYGNERSTASMDGAARMSVGKWLIPSSALRFNISSYNFSNKNYVQNREDREILMNSVGVDYILNLNQLTGGEIDLFEFNLLAGAEIGYVANKRFKSTAFMPNVGVQGVFSFNDWSVFAEWNTKYNVSSISKYESMSSSDKLGVFLVGINHTLKDVERNKIENKNRIYFNAVLGVNIISSLWDEKPKDRFIGGAEVKYGRVFGRNVLRPNIGIISVPSLSEGDKNEKSTMFTAGLDYMYIINNKHIEVAPFFGIKGYKNFDTSDKMKLGYHAGLHLSTPISDSWNIFAEPKFTFVNPISKYEELRRYDELLTVNIGLMYRF